MTMHLSLGRTADPYAPQPAATPRANPWLLAVAAASLALNGFLTFLVIAQILPIERFRLGPAVAMAAPQAPLPVQAAPALLPQPAPPPPPQPYEAKASDTFRKLQAQFPDAEIRAADDATAARLKQRPHNADGDPMLYAGDRLLLVHHLP